MGNRLLQHHEFFNMGQSLRLQAVLGALFYCRNAIYASMKNDFVFLDVLTYVHYYITDHQQFHKDLLVEAKLIVQPMELVLHFNFSNKFYKMKE